MSFTQKQKINTHYNNSYDNFCNGCAKHCKFGVRFYFNIHIEESFCPTIDGNSIEEYELPNGKIQQTSQRLRCKDGAWLHDEAEKIAIKKAAEIAKLCDYYKTR